VNKKYVVRLDVSERVELHKLISSGKGAARKLAHARILLQADVSAEGPGWNDQRIAEALGVSTRTVEQVRQRCVEEGLEAALNRKKRERPPVEKKLDGAREARLVAICCSSPPAGQVRWTLNLLADRLVELQIVESISPDTVGRALKKMN
jgi:transposase